MARPSLKTDHIVDEICGLLSEGHSLRSICRKRGFPAFRTVLDWLATDDSFRTRYMRAREIQSHVWVDMMYDESSKVPEKDPVTGRIDPSAVKLQDNKVKTMQWLAMKLNPKSYGNQLDLKHSGSLDIADTILQARRRIGKSND